MKKLGFGLMRLPLQEAGDPKKIDQETLNRMTDRFLAEGFTYFDTAYPYHQGMSERAVKKALTDRYPRESFLLADKMPLYCTEGMEDYERVFQEQLEKTGAGYFDYYLLHAMSRERYEKHEALGLFEFARKLKAEGKVRHIGFSFHDTPEVLDRILREHPEMEFVQLQINYLDWDAENVQSRRCYETARAYGKDIIVMEPVKGGYLASLPEKAAELFRKADPDLSPASWAVRFAASLPGVIMVLSGMSTPEQMEDNLSYMKDFRPLTEEEQELIRRAETCIEESIAIPCTGCRYCADGCPEHIAIPELFALYNMRYRFGSFPSQASEYRELTGEKSGHGKPEDCIACRQCEGQCPQHIEIVDWLKKIAADFQQES